MHHALAAIEDPLVGPSALWDELSRKHLAQIRRLGFAQFKRTLNFDYAQWDVVSLRSPHVAHLLRQLAASRVVPRAALGSRMDEPARENVPWAGWWGKQVYRLHVGLLWDLATSRDDRGCLEACREAALGRPIGIRHRGRIITQDLALTALELSSIGRCLDPASLRNVAEIGAGYGRFAHAFMTLFPRSSYWIFDVPPALAVSEEYLAQLLGAGRTLGYAPTGSQAGSAPGSIRFAFPPSLRDLPDASLDLVVSTYCLDELPAERTRAYLDLIDAKGRGWVYLKGVARRRDEPTCPQGLLEMPYPGRWRLVHQAVDPMHPAYIERIFDLR